MRNARLTTYGTKIANDNGAHAAPAAIRLARASAIGEWAAVVRALRSCASLRATVDSDGRILVGEEGAPAVLAVEAGHVHERRPRALARIAARVVAEAVGDQP